MEQLAFPDFKSRLKLLIAGGNATGALDELLRALPHESSKYNIAIQLSQQGKINHEALLRHVISFEQAQVQQAAWTNNLLALIDLLHPDDFSSLAERQGSVGTSRPKAGSVLYAIPSRMKLLREQQCAVRLSFDEAYLLQNFFKTQDSHIRALRRLDDRMEVELIDPSEQGAFAIRSISTPQQKVERDDYTEWIFFVKPLHEGLFPLFLKVSVILLEDGEKVRKEVVLQEVIDVVTELPEKELEIGAPMRHSGFVFIPAPPEVLPVDGDAPKEPKTMGKPKPAGISSATSITVGQWLAGAVLVAGGLMLWTKRDALSNLFNTTLGSTEILDESTVAEARLASMTIRPPFTNVNVAPSIFTVNPSQDRLLTMPTGTTIFIPAGIFVWPDNRPVHDSVQIHFREFHQSAEIISSGIPMKVRTENGTKEDWFQTAGMFEIYGTSTDGREVRIADGKSLTVELASHVDGPYDFWKYEPDDYNWQKKQSGATTKPAPKLGQTNNGSYGSNPSSGLRPALKPPAGPDDPRYKIEIKDLDLSACPQLKGKRTLVLLYAGKNPSDSPEKNLYIFKQGLWHERQLRPTANPDIFELSLYNDTLEYVIPVNIMLEGTELAEAKAEYEKRLRSERAVEMGFTKEEYMQQQAEFRRKMTIQGFGVYNYDKLYSIADPVLLFASFDFGVLPKEQYKDIVVYLITDQQRTVIALPFYDWSSFRFSPSVDNCLVAILPGDKVAVFSQGDFNAQMSKLKAASNKPYTFHMRLLEKPVGSVPDLQEVINSAILQ